MIVGVVSLPCEVRFIGELKVGVVSLSCEVRFAGELKKASR